LEIKIVSTVECMHAVENFARSVLNRWRNLREKKLSYVKLLEKSNMRIEINYWHAVNVKSFV
jgi:hypothetical protein